MNKWFAETFIPSLFEKAGGRREIWLTAKQTQICRNNMEEHVGKRENPFGGFSAHCFYKATVGGREITVSTYKNGCGFMSFRYTPEEALELKAKHDAEKEQIYWESVSRIRKNPERYEKHLISLHEKLNSLKEDLEWYKDDPDGEEDVEYYTEKIREIEKKINDLVNYTEA